MSSLTQTENSKHPRPVRRIGRDLRDALRLCSVLSLATIILSSCASSGALWSQTPASTDVDSIPCQEIAENHDLTPSDKDKVFRIDEDEFRCKDISNHAFVTGLYGYVRTASTGEDVKDKFAEQKEFDPIFEGLRTYLKNNLPRDEPLNIMIFAHGGMVTAENAIKVAGDLAPVLLKDGYYPIFPIWRADLSSAYGDYLFRVNSSGQSTERNKFLVSPIRLAEDILSGVIRTPEHLVIQGERFTDTIIKNDTAYFLSRTSCKDESEFETDACQHVKNRMFNVANDAAPGVASDITAQNSYMNNVILPEFPASDELYADPNNSSRKPTQTSIYYNNPAYVAFRWFVAPTFVGGPGPNIWANLVRNTRFAIYSDSKKTMPLRANLQQEVDLQSIADLNHRCAIEKSYYNGDEQRPFYEFGERGAVSLFFDRLECEVGVDQLNDAAIFDEGCSGPQDDILKEKFCRGLINITFAGHSMGSIVGNDIISQHPKLPWRNIIYMAAAASIRDTNYHLTPVLRANPEIRFYNTMLHPLAEARELMQMPGRLFGVFPPYTIPPQGTAPHGSLLEWIDEMFEGPRSPDQRTVGKWHNVQTTKEVFPLDVQKQMIFHVFPNQWKTHDLDYFDKQCALTGAQEKRWESIEKARKKVKRCHPVQHVQFNNYSFWRNNYLLSYIFEDSPLLRIDRAGADENVEESAQDMQTLEQEIDLQISTANTP